MPSGLLILSRLACQRINPRRHKDRVFVGCGAGFGGDRPLAAFKLLQRVQGLDYLVLECLAERTLADRYQAMVSGGHGYDPRSMMSSLINFFCCFFFNRDLLLNWAIL